MESIASALTHVSGEQHSAYKLRTLDISGAAVLLRRHLSDGAIDEDGSHIREIVDCVDRLPLVIARIAACLKQAKATLAELLAMFKRNRTRINVRFLHDDFYRLRELVWPHR